MAYQKNRRQSHGRRSSGGGSRSRFGTKRGPRKENIPLERFIKTARPMVQKSYKAKHTFNDFDVAPLLRKNIAQKGFDAPSPIQDQAIPQGLRGNDVIGIANTGTGKTVAFAVPVIHKLLTNKHSRVLVVAPTRELAQQIFEEFRALVNGSSLQWAILIGGASMRPQLRDLSRNPHIVIGTPGRIKDHLERKSLDLSGFDMVVLDEVDRMLDMGFVKDMRIILAKLAKKRQSFFFSATMNKSVRTLIDHFAQNPVMISVTTGPTSDNVAQDVVRYKTYDEKIEKLHDLLIENNKSKVLVFDDTKRSVDRLSRALNDRGFKSDSIHGDKSQGQRQRALAKFKGNKVNILVATDVAARGIDVPNITHVINYSTPQSYEDYVHRIGRAGRAGQMGHALTFVEEGKSSSQSVQSSGRDRRSNRNSRRRRG